MSSTIREVMHTAKDRGASAVEYALMVAAIAAVIVGIVFGLGSLVGDTFNGACKDINAGAVDHGAPAPGGVDGTGTPNQCAP